MVLHRLDVVLHLDNGSARPKVLRAPLAGPDTATGFDQCSAAEGTGGLALEATQGLCCRPIAGREYMGVSTTDGEAGQGPACGLAGLTNCTTDTLSHPRIQGDRWGAGLLAPLAMDACVWPSTGIVIREPRAIDPSPWISVEPTPVGGEGDEEREGCSGHRRRCRRWHRGLRISLVSLYYSSGRCLGEAEVTFASLRLGFSRNILFLDVSLRASPGTRQ